jgi:hypothetical protein
MLQNEVGATLAYIDCWVYDEVADEEEAEYPLYPFVEMMEEDAP